MFKKICILAILLTLSLPAFSAGGYSSVLEDLPLMPGMVEKTDEAVVFDKPNGRIVDITAETRETPDAVRKFYAESLPPLGWRAAGAGYVRESEKLTVTAEEENGSTTVHFNLTPKE